MAVTIRGKSLSQVRRYDVFKLLVALLLMVTWLSL
jgi:hypothetical protein